MHCAQFAQRRIAFREAFANVAPSMTTGPKPSRLRFPASRRLRLNREFVRVRTKGRTVRGRLLLLGVLEVAEESAFRVGFVTSKRVGGAVLRNRVRRRLREIVRRHQHDVRDGVWLVVVARPAAAGANSAELEAEWWTLLQRGNAMRTTIS
jgi:ribonuclease P protein component